jgi:hypothetical protein
MLKFVMEHDGGHHSSSFLYGHGFDFALFSVCSSVTLEIFAQSFSVSSIWLSPDIFNELSFLTNKAN